MLIERIIVLVRIFEEILKVVQIDFFSCFRLLKIHIPQNLHSAVFDEIDSATFTALHANERVLGKLLQLSLRS